MVRSSLDAERPALQSVQSSPALVTHVQALAAEHAWPLTCHHGLLGSSDSFIYRPDQIDSIRSHFGDAVACVDQEGGAIAHVCTRFGVPFLILRALSDVPGKGDNALDFQTFLNQAARNSAALCQRLVQHLAQRDSL